MSTRGYRPPAKKSAAEQVVELFRQCNGMELDLLMKELKNRYHDRVIVEVLDGIIRLDIEPYEDSKTFTKKEILDLLKQRKHFYEITDSSKK